jgi:hypothetical protein
MSENPRLLIPQQNEVSCPTIKFRDGQFLFTMNTLAGTTIEALRSEAAVREAFTGIPVDSGWMNLDVNCRAVVRWGDGSRGEWAVLYVPPGLHKIELTTDVAATADRVEHITAPLPALIFFGAGVKYWLWALRAAKFDPYHELMRAPLPNVFQDGEVCWGPHKPPASTGRAIVNAWELFISTTFSNHAASGKSKKDGEDVRTVLREAAQGGESASYPTEDLVRFLERGGMTADKVIRAFTQNGEVAVGEH